jgi:uroporphyrin-III C-methyltransferase
VDNLTFELPGFEPGWVWLAGAGPGDPGLLTLHALNGLRQADVVVYDALVDPRVLELARTDAERVYAGKRGGRPSPKQPNISRRLIAYARDGRRVLRLKGGDPFVFGRGGEEGLALVAAGVPFRIIPGISAGLGGLAYAGIPLTHRTVNSSVTFVTGHGMTGAVPESLDWAALSRGSPVIVFYMALRRLGEIRSRLMENGRAPEEAVAVVCAATTDDQAVLESTLGSCVEDVAAAEITAPALIVLGDVVRLRAGLDWLGALAGRVLEADPLGTRDDRRAG